MQRISPVASQTWGVSKVNRPDDFARLTYLNSLLSLLTGGASSKTEQITAVLRFLRAEDGPDLPPADYDANVARIVELHDPGKRRFSSIVHWDLRQDSIDPLWLRANVLEKLDKLTAHSRGLLVVSGLRQKLCPPPKRWTRKRAALYHDLVSLIEKTAIEKASPQNTLTLLFV